MMMTPNATELKNQYLARLEQAMEGVPYGIATEIRAGIVEELEGADAALTARRIAELGEPEAIAREARSAAETPAPTSEASDRSTTDTRGFAIFAALMLSFGGIVIPVVGWIAGAVLVCFGTLWRGWEKALAILVPLITASLSIGLGLLPWSATGTVTGGDGSTLGDAANPLLPTTYDLIWVIVIGVGLLLIPASGLWLLWRMRRRSAVSDA